MKNFVFNLQRFAATLTQYNVYELNDGSETLAIVTVDSSNKLTVKEGGVKEVTADSDGTYNIVWYKLTLTAENGRLKSASLTLMGIPAQLDGADTPTNTYYMLTVDGQTFNVTFDNSGNLSAVTAGDNPISVDSNGKVTITVNNKIHILSGNTSSISEFPETLDTDGSYLIKTVEDLQTLSAYVNGGNDCDGLTFKLGDNITVSGNFTPIGNDANQFKGTFDGDDKIISGLAGNNLFGNNGGTIQNVKVINGAIVDKNNGTVTDCYYYTTDATTANTAGTRIYKLTLPDGVTVTNGAVTIGNEIYYLDTVTLNSSQPIKNATKNNDGSYSLMLTQDTTVEFVTFPETLDKDTDGSYLITSVDELKTLAAYVNGGNDCSGLTFKLGDNITVSKNFTPIGNDANQFKGTFDGDDKIISGLAGNNLFGNNGGTIQNVKIIAGFVVDKNNGTVNDCYYYTTDAATPANTAGTRVYKLTLPDGVTITNGAVTIGNEIYYTSSVTLNSNRPIKNATKNNDGSYSLTLTQDTTVEFVTFPETLDKDGMTYLIKTVEDLQTLAAYVNGGNDCDGLTFKLGDNITLSENFTPIGNDANPFKGTFDGDGKIISGLTGSNLFGNNGGTIRNVKFIAGFVVDKNDGTVNDCYYYTDATPANTAGTRVYKLTLPASVTVTNGAVAIGNEIYYTSSVTLSSSRPIKGATKNNDGTYSLTLSQDTTVEFLASPTPAPSGGRTSINNNPITTNTKTKIELNNKKQTSESTSATLTSDFSGKFDATKYPKLTTIKVAADFSKDVKIIGNDNANRITTGAGNDSLDGGDGNDYLYGGEGDDTLSGGSDNDRLFGDIGNDSLDGDSGNDYLNGGEGNDTLSGGSDNDRLFGDVGDDLINGGDGRDFLSGGEGDDTLSGGSDNDRLFGDVGDDLINGGDGRDFLSGGEGDDTLSGGDDNDRIFGDIGNDSLDGGDGRDYLNGGEGDDTLSGDNGNDVLSGGIGNDLVSGGAGNDIVHGGIGDDTLDGGTGNDYLNGGEGNDELHGGNDDDKIYGGADTDYLYGDNGNDSLFGSAGDDFLFGGDGDDKIYGGADTDYLYGDNGNDSLFGSAGDDFLFGGDGDDKIYGGSDNDSLDGENGNDLLKGGSGNDTLNGGSGNDKIFGEQDSDLLDGDSGNDTLSGGSGNDTLHGDDGNDSLNGGSGEDYLFGDAGNDTLSGGNGNDFLDGGIGDDFLFGDAGDDEIIGFDGNDYLSGGRGADSLYGGNGDDKIIGGKGDDSLWGDDGADTFIYGVGDGNDVIFGFGNDDTLLTNGFSEAAILPVYDSENNSVTVKLGSGSVTFKDFAATKFNIGESTWQLSGLTFTKK